MPTIDFAMRIETSILPKDGNDVKLALLFFCLPFDAVFLSRDCLLVANIRIVTMLRDREKGKKKTDTETESLLAPRGWMLTNT